jgi:excisionase family DNA binding protein
MSDETLLESPPEVLTVRDGAKILRCTESHFRNLLSGRVAGLPRLPHIRLGRSRVVRRSTLMKWLEQAESKLSPR